MKKLAVFLALLMFFALAVPALAEDASPSVVLGNDITAKAGETITVNVALKNNPGIVGVQVFLGYDSNVMSFVSATAPSNGFYTVFSSAAGANPVKIIAANLSYKDVTGDVSLGEITFKMADNVAAGVYDISVSAIEAYQGENLVPVSFVTDTAKITVKGTSSPSGGTHTHKYTETVVEPVGAEAGYTLYTCACGHSYKGNFVYAEKPVETKTVVKLTIGSAVGYVGEEAKTLDAAPVIKNDRTMLPVRFVAEAFGAVVAWDGETSTATITGADGVVIRITIGAATAQVGDKTIALDSPAYIDPASNRTYLPVRVVAEALGAEVSWDGATSTATLTK